MKKQIYDALELNENSGRLAVVLNILIIVLIIASVASVIIESITNFATIEIFLVIELFSVIVFTIEYILRLWSCTEDKNFSRPVIGRIKYALSPLAIIDLLAILPFYLPYLVNVDLRVLRLLRLLRLFRLFKLTRYTRSFNLLKRVLIREKEALIITFFILLLVVIISSSLMYFAEKDVQPDAFVSIPHSMWWAVASLTTVGYGDIYPISPIGKLMASVIAILGIGFVALPTGILSSGYIEELKNDRCQSGDDIGDLERLVKLKKDGHITDDEFEILKKNIMDEIN